MAEIWRAGVVSYDLDARTCTYYGIDMHADMYVEEYPHVELDVD